LVFSNSLSVFTCQPLAVVLHLPGCLVSSSSRCLGKCNQGVCIRYVNVEEYFCHRSSGWSGVQCDRPINYVDHVNNRPIYICPLTKSGPQCLLTSSCSGNECQHGGHCVPAQLTTPNSNYVCTCPFDYFGSRCRNSKGKLEVSLNNLMISSYFLAFIFTISNQPEPRSTIMLQKLTLFQRVFICKNGYFDTGESKLRIFAIDEFYVCLCTSQILLLAVLVLVRALRK
jgi:hypothetical protein